MKNLGKGICFPDAHSCKEKTEGYVPPDQNHYQPTFKLGLQLSLSMFHQFSIILAPATLRRAQLEQ